MCIKNIHSLDRSKAPAGKGNYPKCGLTCFDETFMLKQTFVLRMNFSAKSPPIANM